MKNKAGNRILSILLTLVLLCGGLPVTAFAEGVCTHVCDHGTCSYVEGADCGYVHVHDDNCGYAAADSGCTDAHTHNGQCGYVESADCNHVHDENCGGHVASVKVITFDIPLNEYGEAAFYLPENKPITDADLLLGVTAVDKNGDHVTVTVKDVDGLDMDNPAPKSAVYPNPPYVITYMATHPDSGDEFTETRECYVTAAVAVPTGDGTLPGMPCTTQGELVAALANTPSGGTIYVSDMPFTGQIAIPNKTLTIVGVGGNVTLTAVSSRHFTVVNTMTAATLTFTGVTLGGGGTGGGITNYGNLTLNGVTISNCNGGSFGGGIYNEGDLTLNGVTINNCRSTSYGGGIYSNTGTAGTVTITNSTITGNTAANAGGGIYISSGAVIITSSTITGSTATVGGGIYNNVNTATNIGSGCTVSGGVDNFGILNNSGTITIPSGQTLRNRQAGTSGTINNNGDIIIESGGTFNNESGCTVNNNAAGVITNNSAFTNAGTINNNGRINGNAITDNGSFSGYPVNYVPPVPPTPQIISRSRSSNSVGGSYTPALTETWLDGNAAADLAVNAKSRGENFVRTRSAIAYRIRAAVWARFEGLRYEHDTLDGGAIRVRLYVKNPEKLTKDMIVSGYTKGSDVERVKVRFEKWFTNNLRAIHFDQQGAWGQPVEVAAKLDLTGMDTENLYFCAYDKATSNYKRIVNSKYRIDKNGFLHFTTEYAGDIVISEGPLERK